MGELRFTLNGEPHVAASVDPNVTLLHYLRGIGLTGVKEGCAEGECGACAVALVARGPSGEKRYEAVNGCLVLLASVAGRDVVTAEGVARGGVLHPVQRALAEGGGSQCGYCTPGFVVSLFAEYHRSSSGPLDEESIAGNLCRCTGYRPIRDAAIALAATRAAPGEVADAHRVRLAMAPAEPGALDVEVGGRRFVRPATLAEACKQRAAEPGLVPLAGGTDVVVELNQRHVRHAGFLALEAIPELRVFAQRDDVLAIGAGVPLAELEERLHGDATLRAKLPMLAELLPLFSSRLIRTRATLGGNLATASPIGDSPPVLLALDATLLLARHDGRHVATREVALDAFFTGYRRTALASDELIVEVRVPLATPRVQRFYKVSKRKHDDISTVAGALALDVDGGVVTRARLAFGGVAATPVRTTRAEAALVSQPATRETFAAAARIAESEVKPMDDHRGSARYRSAMVRSLVEKLFDDALAGGAS